MISRLRLFLADLTGRADRRLVALLLGQLDTGVAMARLVRELAVEGDDVQGGSASLRDRIRDLEHQGDDQRGEVVQALSVTLVTPIDREDLFRLSGGIDDVLDNLRDFAREWSLYRMHSSDFFGPLLDEVIEGMAQLRTATSTISDRPAAIPAGALQAQKAGNLVRRNYQLTMAQLFDEVGAGPVSVEVLKRRELLRRLDIVGLRIREAAALLADAAVKRSH